MTAVAARPLLPALPPLFLPKVDRDKQSGPRRPAAGV